jgi:hypothetical protein
MSYLDFKNIEQIDKWIHNNARQVEIAKWDYLFNSGSKDEIVNEMLKYQNNDGGFGNGFESDILLPLSAAIPSAEAIFTAYDYELDCTADWFGRLLNYFENSILDIPSFWEPVPKELDNYPHAPWWEYQSNTVFSPNPCAIVSSALILYGNQNQKQIGYKVAEKCINFLCSDVFCADHDCYNLQRLVEALQTIHSPLASSQVIHEMQRRIKENVCYDEAKWMEYVAQPLDLVDNPNSLWYDSVHEGVENNFMFWIEKLNNEGVWTPNFAWWIDSEVSRNVTKNWKGYLAVKRAKIFREFDRIKYKL